MALPKDVKFVTFDCYGTLIDWEAGVFDAFQKEADRDGFTIDRDTLIPRFVEIQRDIQRGSYELYAEVLRPPRRHFRSDFDLVVTAQQVRSYKPDPAHFKECARRIEKRKKNWVHIASGYPTDVEPCLKMKVPVIWVNRHGEELEAGPQKPTAEVKTLRDPAKLPN